MIETIRNSWFVWALKNWRYYKCRLFGHTVAPAPITGFQYYCSFCKVLLRSKTKEVHFEEEQE